jgi:hypothetical protein
MNLSAESLSLSLNELGEHFFGVDGDEDAAAACENFTFFVEDFSHVDVLAAMNRDFPAFYSQRRVQRHGLEIFDRHFFGKCDDFAELVHFAHGVIKDGRDNAAVAMAGRSGVALAEAKVADEGLAWFVEREPEVHAFGIVRSAREAEVFFQWSGRGFVAVNLAWHGGIVPSALTK